MEDGNVQSQTRDCASVHLLFADSKDGGPSIQLTCVTMGYLFIQLTQIINQEGGF